MKIINFFILILLFNTNGYANASESCEQQYQEAWDKCNDKYNGKCKFLGEKHKPTCDLNIKDKKSSNCAKQYEDAWARCNAKYNGKCTYLGNEYKPSCEL